uniref:Pathogenesis-related protein PR1-RK, C-terminally truncated n=1 Tax=Triticum urartu TaxID=4572 RepID=A0A2Z4EIX4_TRIUA|nr:pathogenesis-related protein PR1-RK, C-terminally truncated [Triticum urartu]AWV55777.1 truncated pathogenesis-related protein PR1-RK isoform 1 [Triticum urartu]
MAAAAASLLLLQCVVTMLAGAATADAQYSAQTFADLQNAARADVGVAPLAWDDTLAGYAQRYAGERKGDCKLVHSDGPYGESIFWGNKGGNWTASDAVALWVQEKQYYNCSDGSCAAGKICSHYTQIVWANTTRVGCAAVACDGNLGTFILCEYDPRGNVPGVRPRMPAAASSTAQRRVHLKISSTSRTRPEPALAWACSRGTARWWPTPKATRRRGRANCRKVSSGGPYGENIFQGGTGISWTVSDALFSWLGEKQKYDCASNACKEGQACGEYTQLVWANSTRVGCASVTCEGGGTFITCNHDPPGNIAGERPYLGCGGQAGGTPPPTSDKVNGTAANGNGNGSNANSSNPRRNGSSPAILPIVLPVVTILGLISAISIYMWIKRPSPKKTLSYTACSEDIEDIKSVLLDPSVIRTATSNFSEENKLGEGGFGQVYKGMMPDGQEIAVKRLSEGSKQGLPELKNELLLVAKLQHRNLVKLIGACLDGEDKLLVYEYIPKKSLDAFIFDDEKRGKLAWDTRYKIICGIARGLAYLHDESRIKVIHRPEAKQYITRNGYESKDL